jgi:hypothetical protein
MFYGEATKEIYKVCEKNSVIRYFGAMVTL